MECLEALLERAFGEDHSNPSAANWQNGGGLVLARVGLDTNTTRINECHIRPDTNNDAYYKQTWIMH